MRKELRIRALKREFEEALNWVPRKNLELEGGNKFTRTGSWK